MNSPTTTDGTGLVPLYQAGEVFPGALLRALGTPRTYGPQDEAESDHRSWYLTWPRGARMLHWHLGAQAAHWWITEGAAAGVDPPDEDPEILPHPDLFPGILECASYAEIENKYPPPPAPTGGWRRRGSMGPYGHGEINIIPGDHY